MTFGLIGKKIGMSQLFEEGGNVIPVTIIRSDPATIVDLCTMERNGYKAIRVGYEEVKEDKLTKPLKMMYQKLGQKPHRIIQEFRVSDLDCYKPGETLDISRFTEGDIVDVVGTGKGKGFQGVMKRWNMSGGPGAHGTHFRREPGSTGQCEFPGRIFKNKRMPGRMGGKRITVQNLKIVKLDKERNLVYLKGSVPGPSSSYVCMTSAKKQMAVK